MIASKWQQQQQGHHLQQQQQQEYQAPDTSRTATNNFASLEEDANSTSSSIDSLTQFAIQDMKCDSQFFKCNEPHLVPNFSFSDINFGPLLGSGEFGDVYDVISFNDVQPGDPDSAKEEEELLQSENIGCLGKEENNMAQVVLHGQVARTTLDELNDTENSATKYLSLVLLDCSNGDVNDSAQYLSVSKTRARMIKYPDRNGTSRYAVKRLRTMLPQSDMKADALIDLACEAEFLSRIIHPNIVRLRGTVGNHGSLRFMIILDRLTHTLTDKIKGEWSKARQQQRQRGKGILSSILGAGRNNKKKSDKTLSILLKERMLAAYDIARAMKHLHSKRLIFRDLKPDNIGVDPRGNFRLFDFGLVRELKPKDFVQNPDGYNCTGCTGSRRYLAPEVIRCLPYGFKADVYAFGIVFWQIFSLKTPFADWDASKHFDKVVVEGQRPPNIRGGILSPLVHTMMKNCWAENTKERPTFAHICDMIQQELLGVEGDGTILDRSGFLLSVSAHSKNSLDMTE